MKVGSRWMVVAAVLFAVCIALSVYALQLRSKLHDAATYAQSGIASVFMICSPVVRALEAGDKSQGVWNAAHGCLGRVGDAAASAAAREAREGDGKAYAARIRARLDARELPWFGLDATQNRLLPKGLEL